MKQGNTYQIKITLSDEPPIWRIVLIPGDYTFTDFHVAIQDSMGWLDCHLYEFEVTNPVTGNREIIGTADDEPFVSIGENEIISGRWAWLTVLTLIVKEDKLWNTILMSLTPSSSNGLLTPFLWHDLVRMHA